MSEILSEGEINNMLNMVFDGQGKEEEKERGSEAHIYIPTEDEGFHIYDFSRPQIISANQIEDLKTVGNDFCYELRDYLEEKSGEKLRVSIPLNGVDLCTYDEFFKLCPKRSFKTDFLWNGGAGVLSIYLNAVLDGIAETNINESVLKLFSECMNRRAGLGLGKIKNVITTQRQDSFQNFTDRNEIGVVFSFEVSPMQDKFGDIFYIFLNRNFIESIINTPVFSIDSRTKKIPLIKPDLYTTVEAGRCYLDDDFVFEKGQVIMLDHEAGSDLYVTHNDKAVFTGELLVIEYKSIMTIRMKCDLGKVVEDAIDPSLNTKVIIGGFNFDPNQKISIGSMVMLDSCARDNAKIVKGGRMVAEGEICVVDGILAVRVK